MQKQNRSQMFFKLGVSYKFRNIYKKKQLCWRLFQACNFIKKENPRTGVFLQHFLSAPLARRAVTTWHIPSETASTRGDLEMRI